MKFYLFLTLTIFFSELKGSTAHIHRVNDPLESIIDIRASNYKGMKALKLSKANQTEFSRKPIKSNPNFNFPQYSRKSKMLVRNNAVIETQILLDNIVYQEIMTAAAKNKNFKNVSEYLQIFINGVNHIYKISHEKDPTFPSITIRLSNFSVLSQKIEEQIFKGVEDDSSVHLVDHVLKYFRAYGKKNKGRFDMYDHSMLLTGRDLHRTINGIYDSSVLGVAFLNGTCSKSDSKKWEAFSVVEDSGALFLGVYPAVHELAHNLGVKHDPKSHKECNLKHGYIMSPSTSGTNNIYYFSNCSRDSINDFLGNEKSRCLDTTTAPSIPLSSISKVPGEVYTMEEICKHLADSKYSNAIYDSVTVNHKKKASALCKQISCIVKFPSRTIIMELPVPPGDQTSCDNGGKCMHGMCVPQKPYNDNGKFALSK